MDAFLLEMRRMNEVSRAQHEHLMATAREREARARETWEQWEAMLRRGPRSQDEDFKNMMAKLVEVVAGPLNPNN